MLTSAQAESFWEQGLLHISLDLDNHLIDEVINDCMPLYENLHSHGARVQDAWQQSDAVREIARNKTIASCLKCLFGKRAKPFQTLNFPIGTEQRLHSDTIHFNTSPSCLMVGVWVALEDTDESNGSLQYVEGSHKWPVYTMQDAGLDPGYENYRRYEDFIADKVMESGAPIKRANIKKGNAVIWHANLIHGGGNQADKHRSRHSQVTHYFFPAHQYYTPMESDDSRRAQRQPLWIPPLPIRAKFKRWLKTTEHK